MAMRIPADPPVPRARIGLVGCSVGCCAAMLLSLGCGACDSRDPEPNPALPPPLPAPGPIAEAADWPTRVAIASDALAKSQAARVRPAALQDVGEDTTELVAVRRLVYRVSFVVPPGFRDPRTQPKAPAGELHVDLSLARLRARFVGPGWPLPEGSELRLRVDAPGAYVFDDEGGRSLVGGELASWFEGRVGRGRSQSTVRVRREYGAEGGPSESPAELMCSLLAEWTNRPRAAIERRCSGASLPPGFRFGPWSAELTAVVPLSLPRKALRADEADPPRPVAPTTGAATLDPSAMSRIEPTRLAPDAGASSASLQVRNESRTRAVIIAQGVPVGWVDAGASLELQGLAPGVYRIGAIRPFGLLISTSTWVRVPGELVLGKEPEHAWAGAQTVAADASVAGDGAGHAEEGTPRVPRPSTEAATAPLGVPTPVGSPPE